MVKLQDAVKMPWQAIDLSLPTIADLATIPETEPATQTATA
jgi:hypothetical protein